MAKVTTRPKEAAEPSEVAAEPTEVAAEPTEVTAEPTEVTAEPTEVTAEPTEVTADEAGGATGAKAEGDDPPVIQDAGAAEPQVGAEEPRAPLAEDEAEAGAEEPQAASAEDKAEAADKAGPTAEEAPTEADEAPADVDETPAEAEEISGEPETATGPRAEPAAEVSRARRWLRRPSRRVLVTAGLGVVVLLLWAAGGLLFAHNRLVDGLAAQRPVVLDAAKKVAVDLTSIGAQNAEAQIKSLTEESTGEFQKQLSTYAAALQAVLTQSQAAATGTVSGAAIERLDQESATALVAVDAKLSSRGLAAAQPVSYRLAVQLRNVDGKWLASDVNFVG
jgi:hypothetical protein